LSDVIDCVIVGSTIHVNNVSVL